MLLLSLSNLAGEIILPTGIKHIKLYHIPPKQKELAIGPILALYLHGLILVQFKSGWGSPRGSPAEEQWALSWVEGASKSLYAELEIEAEILNHLCNLCNLWIYPGISLYISTSVWIYLDIKWCVSGIYMCFCFRVSMSPFIKKKIRQCRIFVSSSSA